MLKTIGFMGFVHVSKFEITRKYDVSENGSISVIKSREGDTYPDGSLTMS
jgi:hypothetical protein